MGRTLALDTSGGVCSVALLQDGEVLAERHEHVGRGHAEILIPWIAALPDGGRADQIIVGCGPGSFTGVRVGVAAARGLGLAWEIPVYGCMSLALIASDSGLEGPVLVAIEGGHGELFIQLHDMQSPTLPAAAVSLLPAGAGERFATEMVAGSGALRLIEARGFGTALPAEPRARWAEALPLPLRTLYPVPVYGRAPDAKPASL